MVAGKDSNIFGIIAVDEVDVLIDRVGCALVPLSTFDLLIGRKNMHAAADAVKIPRRAVADVIVQLKRLILSKNADCFNSRVDAV